MMIRKQKMIDNMVANFTIKILLDIKVDPDYESINKMLQILYSNAANLLIPQGGFHRGHIRIIVNPALYTTLSTMAWVNPPDPVVYPTVPMNSTTSH